MCERILVVDDELFIRESIADYLEEYDYTVDAVESAEKALENIELYNYDLIITDLSMPGIGGMELIVRTNKLCPMVPKIIVSGKGAMKDAVEAIRNGAYDYIIKPIESFEKLIISVRRALEKRKLSLNNIRYQEELEEANKLLQEKIKELEEAQTQLIQSAKMASLGVLSAGIAHEINNPNAFVYSNLQLLKDYVKSLKEYIKISDEKRLLSPEEDLALKKKLRIDFILEDLDGLILDSLEGSTRIKSIVKDLKEFSSLNRPDYSEYNLNEGISSTLNILRNELKKGVKVIEDYGNIPAVKCHSQQINQIFMNLFMNAIQAMPAKGGELRIKTGVVDNYVFTTVKDNGSGIPPGVLPKIFDPFFTTKAVGKGMGLGLSLSYKIIEKHRGKIEVESEEGKGTEFTIKLPLSV